MVKASASGAEDLGLIPAFAVGIISRSSHTSDFKTGNPVATLPGARRYGVSGGAGWPRVTTLCVKESWIWNFCLSVAARTIV